MTERNARPTKKKKRRPSARQLRFTREGRVFVLVTLGVGAAAVNTGNNLLYLVLGMLLSLIVLSGILSELVLREIELERRLPRRAFAGAPCLIELVVRNDKRRVPSYSIEIEDFAPREPSDRRCYFLKIPARGKQAASYRRTPAQRGVLALREIRVRTRYPFGLFEKSRVLEVEDDLVVYPALAPLALPHLGDGQLGPDVATPRRGSGAEVGGLRDYSEGDDARAIHWRRTAALGRVVVRERHRDVARRLTLILDERRPERPDPEWNARFERLVSQVAAAAARALDEGAAVEVVTRSGASPLVLAGKPPDPIWRFLALLEPLAPERDDPLPARVPGSSRRFEVERGAA